MDRCICRPEDSSLDATPNRSFNIPRPDRTRGRSASPSSDISSRSRVPCPYPGSRISTRVPPYTGEPMYLPPVPLSGSPQWPSMRASFSQEVKNFEYDPDFFDQDRPMMRSKMLPTGKTCGGRMQLHRSNRPEMAVNEPIPESPLRPRQSARPVQRASPCPPQPRPQMRAQAPRVPARPPPRAISAGPALQSERSTRSRCPPVQPVRSTGAIPRVPNVAVRVPSRTPPTPSVPARQTRICPSASLRSRPTKGASPPSSYRQSPPLDAAQLRVVQQARSLGLSQPQKSRLAPSYTDDYVAEQDYDIGVSDRQPQASSCYCSDEYSSDEFEEFKKSHQRLSAPSGRVICPYMSSDGSRGFEQLERQTMSRSPSSRLPPAPSVFSQSARTPTVSCICPPQGSFEGDLSGTETHLDAIEAPSNLQDLLDSSPQFDVQPILQQGSSRQRAVPQPCPKRRGPSELKQHFARQWEKSRVPCVPPNWHSPVGGSNEDQAPRGGRWCPPDCGGLR